MSAASTRSPLPRSLEKFDFYRFNTNFIWCTTFGGIAYITFVTCRRQMRENEKNLRDLDRIESAKLQMDSPEYRCFYTAFQYRQARCLELTITTTASGTLYSHKQHELAQKYGYEFGMDNPLQKMVQEQNIRAHELKLQREKEAEEEKRRLMYNEDGSVREDYLLHGKQNTRPLVDQVIEGIIAMWGLVTGEIKNMMDTALTQMTQSAKAALNASASIEQMSAIRHMKRLKEDADPEAKQRRRDEAHFEHCRTMDSLLNQCAGELYSMLPDTLPAMQPLPPPFNKKTE